MAHYDYRDFMSSNNHLRDSEWLNRLTKEIEVNRSKSSKQCLISYQILVDKKELGTDRSFISLNRASVRKPIQIEIVGV